MTEPMSTPYSGGLREAVEALCDPANNGPRPYAVLIDDTVLLAVGVDELRAVLAAHPEPVPTPDSADDAMVGERECPTCGPTTAEQHPRRLGVTRCSNCKEWLTSNPAIPAPDGDVKALLEVLREAFMGRDQGRVGYALAEGRAEKAAAAFLASEWLKADRAARESAAGTRARADVVSGVRAWCGINEIAAPPLDWEGLGEYLARVIGSES